MTSIPTPVTHLYRLGLVLAVALAAFAGLVVVLIPSSWNFDMSYWHRADALEEMKNQPLIYGGIENLSGANRNAACTACHDAVVRKFEKLRHNKLSCEACHGALFDHVADGKKTAAASIDRSTSQCLNCHEAMINKPQAFQQFRTTEKFAKHQDFNAGKLPPGTTCLKCHDAHDPTP